MICRSAFRPSIGQRNIALGVDRMLAEPREERERAIWALNRRDDAIGRRLLKLRLMICRFG